jgi:hypothetical protein
MFRVSRRFRATCVCSKRIPGSKGLVCLGGNASSCAGPASSALPCHSTHLLGESDGCSYLSKREGFLRCGPIRVGAHPELHALRNGAIMAMQHYASLIERMNMAKQLDRTTLSIPRELRRQSKIKAATLDVSLSSVVRELLARWVAGEIRIDAEQRPEQLL